MAKETLSDIEYATILLGTNSPTIIDDRVRLLLGALLRSFSVEASGRHHLTGELRIPLNAKSGLDALITSPKEGDLRYNASGLGLEIYVAQDIVVSGTVTSADFTAKTITDSAADFVTTLAAWSSASANIPVTLQAFWAVGAQQSSIIEVVDSTTLKAPDIDAGSNNPVGFGYTVKLASAGNWIPALHLNNIGHYFNTESADVLERFRYRWEDTESSIAAYFSGAPAYPTTFTELDLSTHFNLGETPSSAILKLKAQKAATADVSIWLREAGTSGEGIEIQFRNGNTTDSVQVEIPLSSDAKFEIKTSGFQVVQGTYRLDVFLNAVGYRSA